MLRRTLHLSGLASATMCRTQNPYLPELRPVQHVLHDGQGVLVPLWRDLLPLLPACSSSLLQC